MKKSTNEFVAASWYLRSRKSPGPRTSNTSLERAISAEVQPFKVLGNELKGGRAGMISPLLHPCITKTVALSSATTTRNRQREIMPRPRSARESISGSDAEQKALAKRLRKSANPRRCGKIPRPCPGPSTEQVILYPRCEIHWPPLQSGSKPGPGEPVLAFVSQQRTRTGSRA